MYIKLTDYETDKVVLVRENSVLSVRELPPFPNDPTRNTQAGGCRTRIDTEKDILLVRESSEAVARLLDGRDSPQLTPEEATEVLLAVSSTRSTWADMDPAQVQILKDAAAKLRAI